VGTATGKRGDEPELDLAIRHGSILDGLGAEPRFADIGIKGDRIVAVGTAGSAREEIDATGLTVSPGFIDVHGHDDLAVLEEPDLVFKIGQGVTTSIIGNCGIGMFPFGPGLQHFRHYYPDAAPIDLSGFASYLQAIREARPSVNIGVLVGHGMLRRHVMGDAPRRASNGEMLEMERLLVEALDAGALGLSSGLVYEPGRHATVEELTRLSKHAQARAGVYATHLRNEAGGLDAAIGEALEVAERSGASLQISHLKAAGRENHGNVERQLERLTAARKQGVNVNHDAYPYTAAGTHFVAAIRNAIVSESGDVASEWGTYNVADVFVASCPSHREYESRTVAELGVEWALAPAEACDRFRAEGGDATFVTVTLMAEADVARVIGDASGMIGSDGVPGRGARPHPRLFGTFPRVLARYVRDGGMSPLGEMVRRMTSLPATKFGLVDRGVIRPGAYADLVVFDSSTIEDMATYEEPTRTSAGITIVMVNGTVAAVDGVSSGSRAGRVLISERSVS
jgi:N-acyl-D-amino-acid deacylase